MAYKRIRTCLVEVWRLLQDEMLALFTRWGLYGFNKSPRMTFVVGRISIYMKSTMPQTVRVNGLHLATTNHGGHQLLKAVKFQKTGKLSNTLQQLKNLKEILILRSLKKFKKTYDRLIDDKAKIRLVIITSY